jgi:uncharacterized lipoprotein YddW (UPF0748 family)
MLARLLFLILSGLSLGAETPAPIPPLSREFRGAWVATVYNLDWPSRPGLPVEEQKRELCALLDKARALGLNAILFQVRPAADAFYASPYEPWSHYLTGTMGKAPEPFYDPLAYAVEQAHARCLELHAWVNPYRSRAGTDYAVSADHVSKKHPEWTRNYTTLQWLDPGLPAAREHVIRVVRDIVHRYDIDGLHIDDYFYPYPKTIKGRSLEFPDAKTYQVYRAQGGLLEKAAWRRENVNLMVRSLYQTVREEKPWVKFGVSPFGIWKPGVPAGTMAYVDACQDLCADSRYWLQEGWLDYCAPQLYWARDSKEQAFGLLLNWWALQNTKSRHLWPGLATDRVGVRRRPDEMVGQIMVTRQRLESQGHIHWNMKPLLTDHLGISTLLEKKVYAQPALIPESPWMVPAQNTLPVFNIQAKGDRFEWVLSNSPGQVMAPVALWVWREKRNGTWSTQLLPGNTSSFKPTRVDVKEISLSVVDRYGRLGNGQKFNVFVKP